MTTPESAVAEAISCLVHYRGDAQAYDLSLRITVRPSWFARTTRAALLGPFVDAYNRKVKGGPTLDPFAVRIAAADGSVVGGGEGVGAVVQAVQELFVVGRDYCFHRTWRDRDLAICGRPSSELALRTPAGLAVYASERYAAPPAATNAALLPLGRRAHELLEDPDASFVQVRAAASRWLNCGPSEADALACVDGKGRTLLHAAATRGDARLCADLAQLHGGVLVRALDGNHETPIHAASLCGRALVLRELCRFATPEIINERNKNLLSPLQLCCGDDAAGSPAAARVLVERGADVDAFCWDKTPLMLACLNQHAELVAELLNLGADLMLRDGEMRMAVDHCKHPATAEFLWGLMEGKFLSQSAAPAFVRPEPAAPRAFAWRRESLADALEILGCAGAFDAAAARQAWRRLILEYHPDKRPHDFDAWAPEKRREWTGRFHAVQRAYEAVEAHVAALEGR